MHDTLDVLPEGSVYRRFHHHTLTFSLMYAFSENFVLPLSHDEVVHGKRSLLDKMPGDRWQKFANLRALYAYMWAHPGKKLLFMGGELARVGGVEPRRLAALEPARVRRAPGRAVARSRPQPRLPRDSPRCTSSTTTRPASAGSRRTTPPNNVVAFARLDAKRREAARLRLQPLAGPALRLPRRHAALLPLARGR